MKKVLFLLSLTLASTSPYCMEEAGEFDWSSLQQSTPFGLLPTFQEFDHNGEFYRYRLTLENAVANKTQDTPDNSPTLHNILEELKAVDIKRRNDPQNERSWAISYIDEYMKVVDTHKEELESYGIDYLTIPTSLILKKLG